MDVIFYVDFCRESPAQKLKLDGIRRCADAYGWSVRVLRRRAPWPERLKAELAAKNPLGCIVECSAGYDDLPPSLFRGVPVVYLDCEQSLYGSRAVKVTHDGALTAQAAFRELSISCPKAYAVVGCRERFFWSLMRERAFARRVRAFGKRCRMFHSAPSDRANRLRDWVAHLPKKTAVFAINDETAREVAVACAAAGRRIPSDLIILGVDDCADYCESPEPKLSSIRIDFELSGFKACELLHRIRTGETPLVRSDSFGPLMTVRRESTRGFGRYEPRIAKAIDLIRREACNGIAAHDVIAAMSGSRRLSEQRFREAVGHSILEEISSVRLARVFQMLAGPDVSIGEVVRRSGFPTGAALRKAFRLRTGMSLSAWRKQYRRSVVFAQKLNI